MTAHSSQLVLIDTCGWIDFLRAHNGALGNRVEALMLADRAAICSVSIAELWAGARTAKDKDQLETLIATLVVIEVEGADWASAGTTLQNLKQKGLSLSLTDALIAVVARRRAIAVLTQDAQFAHLGVNLD